MNSTTSEAPPTWYFILVVLWFGFLILAALWLLFVPQGHSPTRDEIRAQVVTERLQVVVERIGQLRAEHGAWPSQREIEAFFDRDSGPPIDNWGVPLRFEVTEERVAIVSAGIDGVFGTSDDITASVHAAAESR